MKPTVGFASTRNRPWCESRCSASSYHTMLRYDILVQTQAVNVRDSTSLECRGALCRRSCRAGHSRIEAERRLQPVPQCDGISPDVAVHRVVYRRQLRLARCDG